MLYRISLILLTLTCLFCFSTGSYAQEANVEENDNPVILYSGTPKKYEIGEIKVEGVKNYEDYVLIGLSGLSVGQTIVVPGDDITTAVKRYWRHGLFSDVQILAEKNCWRQDLFKNHPDPTSTYCRHSLPRRKEKRA